MLTMNTLGAALSGPPTLSTSRATWDTAHCSQMAANMNPKMGSLNGDSMADWDKSASADSSAKNTKTWGTVSGCTYITPSQSS
jgi:hypothetical protein